MRNIQTRAIAAPVAAVGALLDGLASDHDRLWPSPSWPKISLDNGLNPGSRGSHGPIRYSVTEYEPGRRVRWTFAPDFGIVGYHELAVTPDGPQRCQITHTLRGRTRGGTLVLWPLVIRWVHEALINDLFDNAQRLTTGALPRPARWSRWVRIARRVLSARTRRSARSSASAA